jgi:hypothetical protein
VKGAAAPPRSSFSDQAFNRSRDIPRSEGYRACSKGSDVMPSQTGRMVVHFVHSEPFTVETEADDARLRKSIVAISLGS